MGNSERGALKKLAGAARRWLGADVPPVTQPIAVDNGVVEGLQRMGVSAEDIAAAQMAKPTDPVHEAAAADADFEVHGDCWQSVMFWQAVEDQWMYLQDGLGGCKRIGLNLSGIESGARLVGLRRSAWPQVFADVREMANEVFRVDAERRAQA